MARAFVEERVFGSTAQGVDVEAPYVAWKHVHGLLYRRTFTRRGGIQSQTMFTTLKRVTKELNYIETHPALMGLAMFEWQPDIFPVWKMDTDHLGRIYSPAPLPGHQFVILAPIWERPEGEPRLTRWLERPSAPGWLCVEDTHLRLMRRPSAPG
jgi:hypothetical protein